MLISLDSVILIYHLDSVGVFQVRATNYLSSLFAQGDRVAVSDLTRLECRVKPLRLGQAAVLAGVDSFFLQSNVQMLPLTTAVYDRATLVRAHYGFKTVDSIHLAAAVEHGCDRFLTNDTRLSRFLEIRVEVLP